MLDLQPELVCRVDSITDLSIAFIGSFFKSLGIWCSQRMAESLAGPETKSEWFEEPRFILIKQ
jgi:hypothetical protein